MRSTKYQPLWELVNFARINHLEKAFINSKDLQLLQLSTTSDDLLINKHLDSRSSDQPISSFGCHQETLFHHLYYFPGLWAGEEPGHCQMQPIIGSESPLILLLSHLDPVHHRGLDSQHSEGDDASKSFIIKI